MRWWVGGLVTLALMGEAHGQGLNTPGTFVAQCEKPLEHWSLLCLGFVDGMQAMMDTMRTLNAKKWECVPLPIDNEARKAILVRYLKEDQSRWLKSTSDAYAIALQAAYPCR